MIKVVYSGTFDPVTYGHIDLVKRALRLFDHVVVAISTGSNKKTLFSEDERLVLAKQVFDMYDTVSVVKFEGLLADFIESCGAKAVIRGLRAVSDFEYEFQMASINHRLNGEFETLFLTPDEKYTCLSSTMIREVARIDPLRVSEFVPQVVLDSLKSKYSN
ncbi:pantetheine-phosphate adenylyltransferase [Fangia hongkongensis]|uniref:pantetheine-phosphate adenylyltransferase n=1 Tax=Fangia hongkongensis TaxID=270495 RepID=UPI00036FED4A|nr:pantetheine-phosphate adenylyltransferase [Fangia hongkongensis]MBK2125350.1 pantetheine-phosphate adenylyltransferase [Fangia hongkongensis]